VEAIALARSVAAAMHSGFKALRQELPMTLRRTGEPKEISADCEQDIQRIADIWTNCRMRFGAQSGAGPYLFGAYTAADMLFAPVASRFMSYAVELPEIARNYCRAAMRHPLMVQWAEDAALETFATPYD